jgi:short-subunit dehydrogenase
MMLVTGLALPSILMSTLGAGDVARRLPVGLIHANPRIASSHGQAMIRLALRTAMRRIMIVGASRGLGAAFAAGLGDPGDELLLVSRKRPDLTGLDGVTRRFVKADLSRPSAALTLARAVGRRPLDVLVWNAGIWEKDAFTSRYSFQAQPRADTRRIVEVNITAALLGVQALLPAMRRSRNPKLIVIASQWGREGSQGPEAAFVATNFARRGLVHALRAALRPDRIPVTALNPGTIATVESPYAAGRQAALRATKGRMIPMHDLVELLRAVLRTSRATCVKEIDVPALADPTL